MTLQARIRRRKQYAINGEHNFPRCHIGRFLDDVTKHRRIHSSLGYLTPVESETNRRWEHTLALEAEPGIASGVSSFRESVHCPDVA
jgi:hypothetical protein